MMDAKPLDAEDLLYLRRDYILPMCNDDAELLDRIIAAERYWREAVRDASMMDEDGDCEWCGGNAVAAKHEPGCPWLLAQD